MSNISYPCPLDCDTSLLLPALPADPYCQIVPDYSQVGQVIIAPCESDDPFTLDTGAAIIRTAIDNDNTDNTAPRLLVGQGGVDEHEPIIYDGAFRKQIVSRRSFTLNFQVVVKDQLVYDFLRAMQCAPRFRFWYIDVADWLYGIVAAAGALGGLIPSQVNVQMPKGAGRDDLQSATLIITWEDKTDPARYASPLPVGDACGTLAG